MATALLRNSPQRLVDKVLKDDRYYEDISGELTQKANQGFTHEAIEAEDARVNITPHRPYSLQEAKETVNPGQVRKIAVPSTAASAPQRTPGHIALNMFRPASAAKAPGVAVDVTKTRGGPGKG